MIKTMAELAFAGRSREPNVSEYYQRQEKIEAEKFAIQSLQKFEQGINLAAFIAEFEVAMRVLTLIRINGPIFYKDS